MQHPTLSRRELLVAGGATLATLALFNARFATAAPLQPGDEVLPWLDQPEENPVPEVIDNQLVWEKLDSWITPNEQFFGIAHYGWPEIDPSQWQLTLAGRVKTPLSLTLDDLKARPRQEVTFTIECSGNSGLPFFDGGIGNARWAGTPLAPLLEEVGVLADGSEVVFVGADKGEEVVRETKTIQNFARSMALTDAMQPENLLCYEMNGEPLPARNGAPLRLIAPGWYGIANVKWLQRIEIWPTRLANRFMARDYVTVRQTGTEAEPIWTESLVGRALLKSAPARVVRNGDSYRIEGAAWGAPISSVEVKIDEGAWQRTRLDRSQQAEAAWVFWTFNWAHPALGEHTITTRAVDTTSNVQPAQDDPLIANKITYWESNGQITRRVNIPA
ncbi:MAG: molybdopterin-dependent oxidoreductase [Anaerolineales bacterium]|nr:molybdopterin-dependent oxidoreductase [Anaerolineales bacterium]